MSNFVLTLQLQTEIFQEDILSKRFEIGRKMYNACLNELHKRFKTLKQSKEYRKVCKMEKDKERNKQFQKLNNKYGLTEYSLHDFVKPMQHRYKKNIDAFTAQKIATRCFSAFQGLIFHKAKKVNYKSYNDLDSLEGKSNGTGIRFIDNVLLWNGLNISVIIKNNDTYAKMSLENKIKYCRIIRKMIKGKYHYYVQLILEGIPPMKITSHGEIKGQIGIGNVGIDIGTQTIAYSSQYQVKLLELAPNINKIDREVKLLQRKMDRSKRATNPNKFNKNGTINTKNKDKWVYSKHYIKIKNIRKELFRKQSAIRKQSHNILANEILNLGDKFYVETMKYSGLQRRSKKTTKNKDGKFNKKKRFGKSLANKAPSMFLTILDNKLKWNSTHLFKIDTTKIKASQYNHISDEYVKKDLSERWNDFGEFKIQRDLYSSFLIMNVKTNLKEINKEQCKNTFNNFKILHDNEINHIKLSGNKLISSMGI
jgi:hypothetical protein